MSIEKLREFLESEEGKKSAKAFAEKIVREEEIKTYQLDRFHKSFNFEEFTEKVIAKYSSDEYKDRWYNRGIEPPENLYFFLFDYAKKYGRECKEAECQKYANPFTSDMIYCKGYYFNLAVGQGCFIEIIKE